MINGKTRLLALLAAALAAASFAQEPSWIVDMASGDRLQGQLGALGPSSVKLILRGTSGSTVEIAAKDIASLTRDPPATPAADGPDRLELHDGSAFVGRYVRIEKGVVLFESVMLGALRLNLDQVSSLSVGGAMPPESPKDPSHAALASKGGSLAVGALKSATGADLTLGSPGEETTLSSAALLALRMPSKASSGSAAGRIELAFANGELVVGASPELRSGTLFASGPGGLRVGVPIEKIDSISYGQSSLSALRSVVVWGAWADMADDGEHAYVVGILRDGLPGWTVTDSREEYPGRDFASALLKARTLVVSETENWYSVDTGRIADALEKPLSDFLARGGNLVICSPQSESLAFWRDLGLIDLEGGDFNDGTVPFTVQGKAAVGAGLGSSFETINGTSFYMEGGSLPVEVWAGNDAGIVVASRKVGKGRVIVVGMDYFDPSDDTSRLLVNAVQAK
ncbi:MAG: hypothetical protein JXA15_05225 [Spirochaetales bacterium]|nr:hypothetical protein [Spirochaetales bacterium]